MSTQEKPALPPHPQEAAYMEAVSQTVKQNSARMANLYCAGPDCDALAEDTASDLKVKLLEKFREQPDSVDPKAAAEDVQHRFKIREAARNSVRTRRNHSSRQARALATMPINAILHRDQQIAIMETLQQVPHLLAQLPGSALTQRDSEIFKKEASRRVGVEELTEERFQEVTGMLGIQPEELKAHVANYNSTGTLSDKDRAGWSRATRKLTAVMNRAAVSALFFSLIALVALTTLASSVSAHQIP